MPNTVTITAASDLLYGIGANMVVTMNGVAQAPVTVSASRALGQSQTFTFDLAPGVTLGSLDIAFTNDAYGGAGLDRNLWVKSVSYAGQTVSLGNAQYTAGATKTTISSGWMPQSGTLSLDPGAVRDASAAALVAGTTITLDKTAYYVSPLGRDTWSGRLAAPNADGTDGPLATLAAAQKKMQATAIKKTYVRGGNYDLAGTISLGSVDAGVTFEGYPGETPVIRAGRAVRGWTQDQATGLWSAPVAASTLPGGKLDALYVDGVSMTRARYPNEVPSDPVKGGWLFADTATASMNKSQQFRFRAGDIPAGTSVDGLKVNIWDYNGWQNYNADVQSIDWATNTITLKTSQGSGFNTGSRYFLYNAKDQLDAPGEWYYDGAAGRVHLRAPTAGFDPAKVSAGTLGSAFSMYGTNNITLKNLVVGDTTATGRAITVNNSSNVTISGNLVRNTDQGVTAMGTTTGLSVYGNRFSRIGTTGLRLEGSTSGSNVASNWFHDVGQRQLDGSGIWMMGSSNNLVGNNVFDRISKFAIAGGSTLATEAAYNNVIEYNEVRGANIHAADGGAIMFTGIKGEVSNSVIRYNEISGTSAAGTVIGYSNKVNTNFFDPTKLTSFAVYLDDYASGYTVTGNYVHDNLGGVLVHGGRQNGVTNNIFANNRGDAFSSNEDVWMNLAMPASRDNLFSTNIVYMNAAEHRAISLSGNRDTIRSDRNLFGGTNAGASDIFRAWPAIMSTGWLGGFSQWKGAGYDTNSLVGDPQFVNPAGGNFTLQKTSPAFGLGFTALPFNRMGILGQNLTIANLAAPV